MPNAKRDIDRIAQDLAARTRKAGIECEVRGGFVLSPAEAACYDRQQNEAKSRAKEKRLDLFRSVLGIIGIAAMVWAAGGFDA